MIEILPLYNEDYSTIINWNKGKGEDFLKQWAWLNYSYPITEQQIADRQKALKPHGEIYKAVYDGDVVGTVELRNIDYKNGTAHIGNYLIDPQKTNKGYGTKAMETLVDMAFEKTSLHTITLKVFDFNTAAMHCYEKVGFRKLEGTVYPNGWVSVEMKITKKERHSK